MKPDRFMIVNVDPVEEKIKELGGGYEEFKIVTAAMAWDTERDEPCLMFSVFEDNTGEVHAQIMDLEDVKWVPAEQVARLTRDQVDNMLVKSNLTPEEVDDEN